MNHTYVIIDTNVPVVANGNASQASLSCRKMCVERIKRVLNSKETLVIDDKWLVIKEYKQQLSESGQPGIGDQFLKWVLRHHLQYIVRVPINPTQTDKQFDEFPDDKELAKFDLSDRKFVAIAIAHPQHPPILNATDSDWLFYHDVLAKYDVEVEFLCSDDLKDTLE